MTREGYLDAERYLGYKHTEEGPSEDRAARGPSVDQGERPQKKKQPVDSLISESDLQSCEKMNLSKPCGIL